jgi:hypothetical protein
MAANQGPNTLLFMSNRTRHILFISAMKEAAGGATSCIKGRALIAEAARIKIEGLGFCMVREAKQILPRRKTDLGSFWGVGFAHKRHKTDRQRPRVQLPKAVRTDRQTHRLADRQTDIQIDRHLRTAARMRGAWRRRPPRTTPARSGSGGEAAATAPLQRRAARPPRGAARPATPAAPAPTSPTGAPPPSAA